MLALVLALYVREQGIDAAHHARTVRSLIVSSAPVESAIMRGEVRRLLLARPARHVIQQQPGRHSRPP
jgi:hypothetical protein